MYSHPAEDRRCCLARTKAGHPCRQWAMWGDSERACYAPATLRIGGPEETTTRATPVHVLDLPMASSPGQWSLPLARQAVAGVPPSRRHARRAAKMDRAHALGSQRALDRPSRAERGGASGARPLGRYLSRENGAWRSPTPAPSRRPNLAHARDLHLLAHQGREAPLGEVELVGAKYGECSLHAASLADIGRA
jgi:hypothetical protein